MAYNNSNMLRIAQVGQKLKFRDMPTLDLAGAIDNYFNARDAADRRAQMAQQAQKEQAYSDALASGNQNAINQAWAAYDPAGYSQYLNQQQQREQDRQWQLEDMARKERAAYGLAAYKNNLQNIAANAERERENAQLDNALASGLITEAEYNQRKRMQILGDIAKGGAGGLPDGVVLTGNKKYDDAYMQEQGKKAAQKVAAEKDAEEMKPAVLQAMARADAAAKSGSGVGLIGGLTAGWGLNPARNAGMNYADIESANTQMNTYLRKQLAATGLTGSELNSAVEAQAYRYQINPTDSESVIRRKLQNFANDKLGGASYSTRNIGTIIGKSKPIKNSGKDWSKVSNEDILKGL